MSLVIFIYLPEDSSKPTALVGVSEETAKDFAEEYGCEEDRVLKRIEIEGPGADVLCSLAALSEEVAGILEKFALEAYTS